MEYVIQNISEKYIIVGYINCNNTDEFAGYIADDKVADIVCQRLSINSEEEEANKQTIIFHSKIAINLDSICDQIKNHGEYVHDHYKFIFALRHN